MAAPINIVRLDGLYSPPPSFTILHTFVEYSTTTDPTTIAPRIGNADVVITTRFVFFKVSICYFSVIGHYFDIDCSFARLLISEMG